MSQPIGFTPARRAGGATPGVWRGTIIALSPLTITVPALTGNDPIPNCEPAVFSPALAVNDKVWVAPIQGSQDEWAVLSRRA